MSKYTGGKSSVPTHNYDRVFCDGESIPMGVVISELNSIEPLVQKLSAANQRIEQLEKRGTKNERSLQKGMAKLNQRISNLERRNGELETLALHMSRCRECAETSVMHCDNGRSLWELAMRAPRSKDEQ